jgi:hypothetical protein
MVAHERAGFREGGRSDTPVLGVCADVGKITYLVSVYLAHVFRVYVTKQNI